jgi:endonuclease G
VPEDFWKVVAMVREESGELSVTGYMLSQVDFMDDLEFAFGAYGTYQVPVSQIERLTGLDFGGLKSYDPLAERETRPFVVLESLTGIVL